MVGPCSCKRQVGKVRFMPVRKDKSIANGKQFWAKSVSVTGTFRCDYLLRHRLSRLPGGREKSVNIAIIIILYAFSFTEMRSFSRYTHLFLLHSRHSALPIGVLAVIALVRPLLSILDCNPPRIDRGPLQRHPAITFCATSWSLSSGLQFMTALPILFPLLRIPAIEFSVLSQS